MYWSGIFFNTRVHGKMPRAMQSLSIRANQLSTSLSQLLYVGV